MTILGPSSTAYVKWPATTFGFAFSLSDQQRGNVEGAQRDSALLLLISQRLGGERVVGEARWRGRDAALLRHLAYCVCHLNMPACNGNHVISTLCRSIPGWVIGRVLCRSLINTFGHILGTQAKFDSEVGTKSPRSVMSSCS